MKRMILGLSAVVAVVSLGLGAGSAVAGKHHKVHVRGECCVGGAPTITGDLQGTWEWDEGGFEAFLASLEYNQKTGKLTFRVPEVFRGTINGRTGVLRAIGVGTQRAKPGTPLYDFSRWPEEQKGTTGDPLRWRGGKGTSTIVSGEGELMGASGVIHFKSLEFLGRSSYHGEVELP